MHCRFSSTKSKSVCLQKANLDMDIPEKQRIETNPLVDEDTIPERDADLAALELAHQAPNLTADELLQTKEKHFETEKLLNFMVEDGVLGTGSLRFRGDLLLRHYETKTEFKIQNKDLLDIVGIGRPDTETDYKPTIDLSPLDSKEHMVSRRHASISPRGDVLIVTDHKSLNGTYLNSQRLVPEQARVLRNGDMLRIGRICLIVYFEFPNKP